MKLYCYILLAAALFGCSPTSDKNFILEGEILGLKKGTIYLEKIVDSKISTIDSIYIDNAKEHFKFELDIPEPELFILSLNKLNTKQLSFFGEKGKTHITTQLEGFIHKAKISGSELQSILENFETYIQKFNDRNLDLIKSKIEAQQQRDLEEIKKIEAKSIKNLERMNLFSANFAIAHKDKAIAPYIAYAKMDNATPQLKQKIYDALEEEIKTSKYGILLNEWLTAKESF